MTTITTEVHTRKREALAATAFGALTSRELDDVARISETRHLEAGAALCDRHQFGQEAFVIAAGQVAVEVDGGQVDLAGAGDLVGDWALFGDGRRTATLRAITPVDIIVVDPREIDSLLAAVPAAARALGPRA
jgi:CRP-like cAMP-binding protein